MPRDSRFRQIMARSVTPSILSVLGETVEYLPGNLPEGLNSAYEIQAHVEDPTESRDPTSERGRDPILLLVEKTKLRAPPAEGKDRVRVGGEGGEVFIVQEVVEDDGGGYVLYCMKRGPGGRI